MKIIISVDFSHKDFNKDFKLSSVLTQEHTVLLVSNQNQLKDARSHYDLFIRGYSSFELDKPQFDINAKDYTIEQITKIINSK